MKRNVLTVIFTPHCAGHCGLRDILVFLIIQVEPTPVLHYLACLLVYLH